jgi:hypothetical protein
MALGPRDMYCIPVCSAVKVLKVLKVKVLKVLPGYLMEACDHSGHLLSVKHWSIQQVFEPRYADPLRRQNWDQFSLRSALRPRA